MNTEVLDIRPGDTLIVYFDQFLTSQQREGLHERLKVQFPDAKSIAIMEGGMRVQVARENSSDVLVGIRDAITRLADQFDKVSSGGNALLTEAS